MGFECEAHRGFHLNTDLYPLRVVGAGETEVADGDNGDVVVSNLVSRGTMLLNYRLGDVAAKLPGPCPCGRTLPMLSFLDGRTDDWVATATGGLIHPQAVRTLFTEERDVWRHQTVQDSPSRFRVTIVAAPGCDRPALQARLDRFGEQTALEVAFVRDLPRTAGGKVRAVMRAAHAD
jgi:phenylacetate-coenzyme A ligase PaaK-like adenylate-forming protein